MRVVVAVVVLAAVACATGSAASRDSGEVSGELTVLAAASLTDALAQIASDFEAVHPGVAVTASFAGSQRLAAQIVDGAPADVFASADDEQMEVAVAAGRIAGEPRPFIGNRLAIVIEPANPRSIDGLRDLGRDGLKVVLAAEEVPAGRSARAALDGAGVAVTPVSLETDVRAVLTKVALGEADAGIVYASDVVAAGDRVDGIAIPDAADVVVRYPVAVVDGAPNPAAARAFVDYLRSEPGQATLARFGFSPL